jgi:hypothetical protein
MADSKKTEIFKTDNSGILVKKYWELPVFENLSFFESAILIFFSKKIYFALSPSKSGTNYGVEWIFVYS